MTFPVVAALAAAGWVIAIVAVLAFCKAAKDGQAMLDQAHAYRNDRDLLALSRDRLDAELARAHVRHEKAAEAWNHELSTYQEQMLLAGEMLRHQEEGQ